MIFYYALPAIVEKHTLFCVSMIESLCALDMIVPGTEKICNHHRHYEGAYYEVGNETVMRNAARTTATGATYGSS